MAATGQAQTSKGQAAARRGNSWRRMFSLVGVAAIVMAAWLVLVPQLRSAATAISTLAAVDPVWLGLAVLAEAGALLSYARLSQHTLAPVRIGFAAMLRIDLATMAVSHITPAGSIVGVGLGYRLLTRSGVSPAKAISGKAVQAVGSAVVLNLLLTVALVFAVTQHGTSSLYSTAIVLILTLLAAVAVVAVLLVRHPLRSAGWAGALAAVLPGVQPASGSRLAASLTEILGPLTHDRRFLGTTAAWAAANWLLDAAALWCAVTAFGHPLGPSRSGRRLRTGEPVRRDPAHPRRLGHHRRRTAPGPDQLPHPAHSRGAGHHHLATPQLLGAHPDRARRADDHPTHTAAATDSRQRRGRPGRCSRARQPPARTVAARKHRAALAEPSFLHRSAADRVLHRGSPDTITIGATAPTTGALLNAPAGNVGALRSPAAHPQVSACGCFGGTRP